METLAALRTCVSPQPWRCQQAFPHSQCAAAYPAARRCGQVMSWTAGTASSYLGRRWSGLVCNVSSQETLSSSVAQDVEFTWSGDGSEVLVSADYLKWEARLPLQRRANGSFSIKQKLAPGKYQIKFIVDGSWRFSSSLPTVYDERGIINNEVTVVACQVQTSGNISETVQPETETIPVPSTPAVTTAPAPSAAAAPAPASPSASASAPADPAPQPAVQPAPAPSPTPSAPAAPKPKAVVAKKAAAKSLPVSMTEDIIPALRKVLEAEEDVLDIQLKFVDNQLQGNFVKNNVPYAFWALFPDGTWDGLRGFSFASYGNSPSTVEPFLVDEKKITPDLVVFWVKKRLVAQKILSIN